MDRRPKAPKMAGHELKPNCPPCLPIVHSAQQIGIPRKMSAQKYGIMKPPPPFAAAVPGNRRKFPSPTADPATAKMIPSRVPHCSFFCAMSDPNSLFPGFSLRVIATVPERPRMAALWPLRIATSSKKSGSRVFHRRVVTSRTCPECLTNRYLHGLVGISIGFRYHGTPQAIEVRVPDRLAVARSQEGDCCPWQVVTLRVQAVLDPTCRDARFVTESRSRRSSTAGSLTRQWRSTPPTSDFVDIAGGGRTTPMNPGESSDFSRRKLRTPRTASRLSTRLSIPHAIRDHQPATARRGRKSSSSHHSNPWRRVRHWFPTGETRVQRATQIRLGHPRQRSVQRLHVPWS